MRVYGLFDWPTVANSANGRAYYYGDYYGQRWYVEGRMWKVVCGRLNVKAVYRMWNCKDAIVSMYAPSI